MLIVDAVLSFVKSALAVAFLEKLSGAKRSAVISVILTVLCSGIDLAAIVLPLWGRCIISLTALFFVCLGFLRIKPYCAVSVSLTCVYIQTAADLTVRCLLFTVTCGDYPEMMNGTLFNHAMFGIVSAAAGGGLLYLVWYILSQKPQETFCETWRHFSFVIAVFLMIAAVFGSLFELDESNALIAPVIAVASVLVLAMSVVVINFFAEICRLRA